MADQNSRQSLRKVIVRIVDVLRLKKKEINAIYFFALMYGLLQLTIPLGIQAIINFIQAYTFSTSLWLLIVLVVAGVAIAGALQVTQMKIIERINQKIFARFGLEYSFHIPRLDIKSVDKYYLPEVVNRFFDAVSLQKSLAKLFLDLPVASIQIAFGVLLLSFYSSIFIVFGILLLVLLIIIIYSSSARGFRTSIQESDYKYAVASWLEEMARSIKTFKYSRGTPIHIKKSDKLITSYLHSRTEHFRVLLVQYWALIIFKVLITASMLIVGAFLAINNVINLGQFVAAEMVIILIMNSVEKFIFNLDTVYDTLTAVEKLSKILDQPQENSGSIELPVSILGPEIKVNEVYFSFDDKKNVLQKISFEVGRGAKVCIRGEEGAGKSMVLKLLSGSYTDFKGVISLNNVPITNYDIKSLRRNTGIILHEQEIFDGTVIENITLDGDDISFSHVNHLATKFGFQSTFNDLAAGYETKLGSTGQKLGKSLVQKILLLRALVHKPQLLLLENPWSALSDVSRQQIQDYLLNDIKSTVIVASNDLDFAAKCDYVIELDNGEVVKAGTPTQVFRS